MRSAGLSPLLHPATTRPAARAKTKRIKEKTFELLIASSYVFRDVCNNAEANEVLISESKPVTNTEDFHMPKAMFDDL
jgi:hypothetical protein